MQNIYQATVDDSTLDDITAEEDNRGRRRLRLATLLAVATLVIMALIGAFDQRKTISQRSGNLEVQVEYPSVVRAGNEIQLRIALSSSQPLSETVKLSVSEDYLTLFEDFSAGCLGCCCELSKIASYHTADCRVEDFRLLVVCGILRCR